MTKVTFVCQWYPPEPAEIPESIAKSLTDAGCELTVLTGIPNFPTGRVHDGYRSTRTYNEEINGVPVRRTPLYASHDANALRRVINYVSWALSSTSLAQSVLKAADVNLVYSSPATAALPAMVARGMWGTPYVLLIQDLWPDSIFATGFLPKGLSRYLAGILERITGYAYRHAAAVVVISPGMVDVLVDRGVPREDISLIYNWLPVPDDEIVGGVRNDCTRLRKKFSIPDNDRIFLYAGNHGGAQGLEPLIDAFIDSRTAPGHLVMMGAGICKPDLEARASGADRVHFHERVSRDEAARLAAEADVHVVCLADDPLFAVTMPSKVQSGLAAAQPMLVIARGDAAEIVSRFGAGRSAKPGDKESVITSVIGLLQTTNEELEAMGSRGREAYGKIMARGVGVTKLDRLLCRVARDARSSGTQPSRGRCGSA